ncbi:hypothetical protein N658DRAFT_498577 [Parathielavia hyrcaniae]|uniref:Uncharacterized protein n=1 Tax=Parathielavia hyrcaniae TaxID=113614 RepID=A0AAN6PWP8_9PEZI|nr:hypothetical protein N658DRAFT_498577 [Parathielavia hyrcaniae]
MELLLSPQPSPTASPGHLHRVHSIINHLRRHRLGDAFEGLLDLGDQMHGVVGELEADLDLAQLDRLFASIFRYSAYGIYDRVDHVIHRLLYIAVRTCQALGAAQTLPVPHGVGWLSTVQSEARQHLEVCRNFLSYITSHPAGRQSRDPILGLAQQLVQGMCPRINGLSKWTYAKQVHAKDGGGSTTCSTGSVASGRPSGLRKAAASPRRQKCPPLINPMPTPPTQTGDVRWPETIPTIPARNPDRRGVLPPTPDTSYPLLDTLPPDRALPTSSKGLREEDDEAQLLDSSPTPFTTPEHVRQMCTGRSRVASRVIQHTVGTGTLGFKLRPEHPFSPRCCSFQSCLSSNGESGCTSG